MCDLLLQTRVIVFTKWNGKQAPAQTELELEDNLKKKHQFKGASQKCS